MQKTPITFDTFSGNSETGNYNPFLLMSLLLYHFLLIKFRFVWGSSHWLYWKTVPPMQGWFFALSGQIRPALDSFLNLRPVSLQHMYLQAAVSSGLPVSGLCQNFTLNNTRGCETARILSCWLHPLADEFNSASSFNNLNWIFLLAEEPGYCFFTAWKIYQMA